MSRAKYNVTGKGQKAAIAVKSANVKIVLFQFEQCCRSDSSTAVMNVNNVDEDIST